MLKKSLLLLCWYLATGTTILIVSIAWLVTWQDTWSPTMLGDRIFVISLIIAAMCEGLRLKKGTNQPLAYLIFPITMAAPRRWLRFLFSC